MKYCLSRHIVVIKRDCNSHMLINRKTGMEYCINDSMFDLLVSFVDGVDVDEASNWLTVTMEDIVSFLKKENIIIPFSSHDCATHYNIKDATKFGLEKITLEITSACNLRCKHCYGDFGTSNKFLQYDAILKLLKKAADLGVYEIAITGGEPLLYTNIDLIIKEAYSYGMVLTLFSNLVLFNESIYQSVFPYIYKTITSIESFDETIHNKYRGGDHAFENTVRAIKYLRKKNQKVTTNLVVGEHNVQDIIATAEFILSLDANIVIDYTACEGRAKTLTVDFKSMSKAILALQKHFDILKNDNIGCGIAKRFLYIRNSGDIVLCPSLYEDRFCFGCIYGEYNMQKIWEMVKTNFALGCDERSDCNCNGGCRARSYNQTGNINAPDKIYCRLFKK